MKEMDFIQEFNWKYNVIIACIIALVYFIGQIMIRYGVTDVDDVNVTIMFMVLSSISGNIMIWICRILQKIFIMD